MLPGSIRMTSASTAPGHPLLGQAVLLQVALASHGSTFSGRTLRSCSRSCAHRHAAAFLQADAEHAVVAGPHEQQDVVRGRVRRAHARVADRHRHVAAALFVDDVQGLSRHSAASALTRFPVGARKRSTNWPESTSGKSSRAHAAADQHDQQAARGKISPHHGPAVTYGGGHHLDEDC